MRSRLAFVFLCLLPACSVHCGSSRRYSSHKVEELILSFAKEADPVDHVTCPDDAGKVEARAECTVLFKNGSRHPVDVTASAGPAGGLEAHWRRPVLGSIGKTKLTATLSQIAGVPVAMQCDQNEGFVFDWDKPSRCTLTTESAGTAEVLVDATRARGWNVRLLAKAAGIQALTDAMMTRLAHEAARQHGAALGTVTSVECPKLVGAASGTPVTCTVVVQGRAAMTAAGEVYVSYEGDLSVRLDWTQPPAP